MVVVVFCWLVVAADSAPPIKWETGSVGALAKTYEDKADKNGLYTRETFRVREVIGDDRIVIECERQYLRPKFIQGIRVMTVEKTVALHKPFIVKGQPTKDLKKKDGFDASGEYKVIGTQNYKGGVYFVVEKQ